MREILKASILSVVMFSGITYASDSWHLCVYIDGSETMYAQKIIRDVVPKLNTRWIVESKKDSVEPINWSLDAEVFANHKVEKWVGLLGGHYRFDTYPLAKVGETLDTDVFRVDYPGRSAFIDQVALTQFLDVLRKRSYVPNTGIIVISDQHIPANLCPDSVFFKGIQVKTYSVSGRPDPILDDKSFSLEIESAFAAFFDFARNQVISPKVDSVEANSKVVYAGEDEDEVNFEIKAKDYESVKAYLKSPDGSVKELAVVSKHGRLACSCKFAVAGTNEVKVIAKRGEKEASGETTVTVYAKPEFKDVTIFPNLVDVGRIVKVTAQVIGGKAIQVDFGDNSVVDYVLGGVEHDYKKANENGYSVMVIAKGPDPDGRKFTSGSRIIRVENAKKTDILPPPKSEFPLEPPELRQIRTLGKTTNLVHISVEIFAPKSEGLKLDMGDGSEPCLVRHGEIKEHFYSKSGRYMMILRGMQGEKSFVCEKDLQIELPLPPPPLPFVDNNSSISVNVPRRCKVGDVVHVKVAFSNVTEVKVVFDEGGQKKIIDYDLANKGNEIPYTFKKSGRQRINAYAKDALGKEISAESRYIEVQGGFSFSIVLLIAIAGVIAYGIKVFFVPRPKITLTFVPRDTDEPRQISVMAKEVRRLNDQAEIRFPHDLQLRYKSGQADGTNQNGFQLKSGEDLWISVFGAAEKQRIASDWGCGFQFGTRYEIFYGELSTRAVGSIEVNEIQ